MSTFRGLWDTAPVDTVKSSLPPYRTLVYDLVQQKD